MIGLTLARLTGLTIIFVLIPILIGKALYHANNITTSRPPKESPMTTVTVIVKDPAIRQGAIGRAMDLWESGITGNHLYAAKTYLATGNPSALEPGDPPPRHMIDALANGYWYVDETRDSTHPRKGTPLLHDGGDGWEYECFWLHGDDLDEYGYTLTDLGGGARTRTEACHWLLNAWKALRG